uniref:NADH dehydrogenase [ubiquinone] 1 beta subcomplex subunit 9 n=1 Tax=Strigamia maritima TaxID=126957 RepID=T1ISA4_STRMM
MAYIQTRITTHKEKVCNLYKRACRALLDCEPHRAEYRYSATLMRARFEANRNIKDLRIAAKLLEQGEEEYFRKRHYQPIYFPNSPKGVAFQRHPVPPSWVLDGWHPLEKAMFPNYFATREKRKDEFIKFWEKKFGKPPPPPEK